MSLAGFHLTGPSMLTEKKDEKTLKDSPKEHG